MVNRWVRKGAGAAVVVAGLVLVVQLSAGATGDDWPQFRGVNRDGISPQKGLSASWPEAGPAEVWRKPLGEGYSSISVVGDRLYTMYAADNDGEPTEFAAAFEAATGKEIWRTPIGEKLDTEFGNGPRSTPTVDGDSVYVLGSVGDFAALSTKDGSVRWKLNLTEKFGSSVPGWGFSTSSIVHDGLVLIQGGGAEGQSYAALDKQTGDLEWSIGDEPPGYNSTLAVKMNGEERFIYVTRGKLMCVDADGKEVWSHEWPRGETHAMPVFVAPDKIFASGAEGVGGRLLKVGDEEKGVEEVWATRFMRNHFSSSVVHDGYLYGFDNATLKCISVADGELAWAKRGLGKGSLILADGHLLVLSDRGKLLLLEASPTGYSEKGSVQALEGKCWTAPVLSRGVLYLRDHSEMVAYDVTD